MSVLFEHVTAVTMDGERRVLKDACVAVEGTKIASVGTVRPQGKFDRVVDGGGKVLMPGLINAHTHLPMTLMRGYGGGCDLHTWLNDYIFPAEARLDDRAVAAGAALGLAEMVASGVTCVADMYDHCDAIIQQVVRAGLSANIARGITLFTDDYSFDTFPGCVEARAIFEEWHGYGDGQILIDACIHGEYTSRPALWEDMAAFARERGLGMHVHVSETLPEQQECLNRWGRTPVQILDEYGVWDCGRALAAHCVYTTPEDWAIMAEKGISCVHNPWSNLKLGSGVAPIPDMLSAGVNVALGTDGMSSHNSADFFSDIKLAACLHNGVGRDPAAVSALQALEMATVSGAKALGRNTGAIVPGLDADLILVDFSAPNLTPCHDPVENLAFSAHGSNVVMNMARGRIIYENGAFLTLDLERIRDEVARYALPLVFGPEGARA